jgi:glucosamine-6-phosphate deaminase
MAQTLTKASAMSFPTDEESRKFEKINTVIHDSSEQASFFVANEIAELIRQRQKQGKNVVLGLATGSSPTKMHIR